MSPSAIPSVLVPVGNHFFSPEALQKAATEALTDHPGATRVLKGTVDSNGVNTVLAIATKDGHAKVSAAFSHDYTGDNRFGVSGSFAF